MASLIVTREDIGDWFELLCNDQKVIDEVKAGTTDRDEALQKYQFPVAIEQRFPSLLLYTGETVGVGEGDRGGGSAERWACLCSLAIQTLVLQAWYATETGDGSTADTVAHIVTQYQNRGGRLFDVDNPPRPLSTADVITWGKSCADHAPTPASMGASYLTMVVHDLTKMKAVKETLAAKYPELNEESLTAKFIEEVVSGAWEGAAALSDIKSCEPAAREAMAAGFMTGFNASQVMQGESTAVAALRLTEFLGNWPAAVWFVDHYMLDTAGILGKPHAFTGTIIVDGYTFELYSGYVRHLVEGQATLAACVVAHREYHEFRIGLVATAASDSRLQSLAQSLGADLPAVRVAYARTLELSRTGTIACADALLGCWEAAVERFGPELMAVLVAEFNITGVADDGAGISTEPAKVSILLEYAPALLNNAAREDAWRSSVPIALALFAVLLQRSRAALLETYAGGGDAPNPYEVGINAVAMRTNPKYAGCEGYTWETWFVDATTAWEAQDIEALRATVARAVGGLAVGANGGNLHDSVTSY